MTNAEAKKKPHPQHGVGPFGASLSAFWKPSNDTPPQAGGQPPGLGKDQARAFDEVKAFINADHEAHILTGGAGTGKTFLLDRIAEYIEAQGLELALAATTHKAAEVLAEKTGRPVRTIHSLLKLRPKNEDGATILQQVGEPDLPEHGIVIIDECSMIDGDLLKFIREDAKKACCGVLFVGDRYQMPPVNGRSAVFDAVFDATIRTSELTEVMRQAAGNPIIDHATDWRAFMAKDLQGEEPQITTRLTAEGDGIEVVGRAAFKAAIARAFEADPDHARVIGYTNVAAVAYNQAIRPLVLGQRAIEAAVLPGERLVANAPVTRGEEIVLPNNAEVVVKTATPTPHPAGLAGYQVATICGLELFMAADFHQAQQRMKHLANTAKSLQRQASAGDCTVDLERREAWRAYFALKESIADLRPPYAGTTHKAQGSTFATVFLDLADMARCPTHGTRARLTYTALTRASHKVIACKEAV